MRATIFSMLPVNEGDMVGGGVPKNVDFELGDISSSGGKLIIELQIYKGTNNNGCLYGLTGIVLKGKFGEETTVIDIATDVHRGWLMTLQAAGCRPPAMVFTLSTG